MSAVTKGHETLTKNVKKILQNANFDFIDSEVDIDIDGDGSPEFSIDVCALHKNTLLVFQCKDVEKISNPKKELNSTQEYIRKILKNDFKVLKSDTGNISDSILNNVSEIKCCYAFTDKLTNQDMQKNVETAKFLFWDHKAVRYYSRVSEILKELTKNEILKEFKIKFSAKTSYEENAVEIKQKNNTMYLVGMHPGLLLKIAYVYRRTGYKSGAYQRIITRDRIESISKFFNESQNLMLPNPVIIVFDEDKDIQDKIKYKPTKRTLSFPVSYCSAWIIDGQHRIYGFKDHPDYKNWVPDEDNDFKIPVVVFDKLSLLEQNKTFLNINYYQKKIDAVLFNDLATVIQDLKHEITWPSLLVSELNKNEPWKDRIKISELDTKKPITISGFAKTVLLYKLLGYNKKTKTYFGNLYKLAPFDPEKSFSDNQKEFNKQLDILIRFFSIIRKHVKNEDPQKDKWLNSKKYGLTKFTSVNALLLVLNSLLEKDPTLSMNLNAWLSVINTVDFRNEKLLEYGRGYPAMPKIANKIIKQINSDYGAQLKLV